jgi:hypothetical protein
VGLCARPWPLWDGFERRKLSPAKITQDGFPHEATIYLTIFSTVTYKGDHTEHWKTSELTNRETRKGIDYENVLGIVSEESSQILDDFTAVYLSHRS